jgi:putative aldouronate transport system permease protein
MRIKKTFGEYIFDTFNHFFLFFWALITIYPLLYVLFSSVSDAGRLMSHRGLLLYPLGINFEAYKLVMKNPMVLRGYLNTFIIVIGGTSLNIVMTSLAAFFLSRKDVLWKNGVMMMIAITMFFSGGMIPSYLVVVGLGMRDSLLALIIPGAVSAFNVIIMRTAFIEIPDSLEESAFMDGANNFDIMYRIVLPLSKSVLAVMALWYGVSHWNSWFSAAIYLTDRKLYPIQLVLREILIQNTDSNEIYKMTTDIAQGDAAQVAETIKYALIIIATVPILCIYPYLQKHFVKGVMIGALKG